MLGGKAELSQIRSGKSEASVSGVFVIKQTEQNGQSGAAPKRELTEDDEPQNAAEWLDQHGITLENNRHR